MMMKKLATTLAIIMGVTTVLPVAAAPMRELSDAQLEQICRPAKKSTKKKFGVRKSKYADVCASYRARKVAAADVSRVVAAPAPAPVVAAPVPAPAPAPAPAPVAAAPAPAPAPAPVPAPAPAPVAPKAAAASGLSTGALVGIGLGIAAIAAAASKGSKSTPPTHTPATH
jgi:hypothetical protein